MEFIGFTVVARYGQLRPESVLNQKIVIQLDWTVQYHLQNCTVQY
jgi:hypothetical protein